jgi:hypothetical protein
MRKITDVVWRAGEDLVYTQESDTLPEKANKILTIKAGRLYKGMLYSFAGGTPEAFFAFADTVDEKGIPVIRGLRWDAVSGASDTARIGTDCSGAVQRSWAAAGADIRALSTRAMCPANGFMLVGEFLAPQDHVSSEEIQANGLDVMCEAYALLEKADAVVCRWKTGHTRMVLGVQVVRRGDGSIDPEASYAETLEQTRGFMRKDAKYFDEKLGEDVYIICGNEKYSFADLYQTGYMPITCRAFTDPSPIPAPAVSDTLTEYGYASLFDGTLQASRLIDAVIMTLTDAVGNPVCRMTVPAPRNCRRFEMGRFLTENRSCCMGSMDVEALPAGKYHCRVVCRLSGDINITVRDFDFVK